MLVAGRVAGLVSLLTIFITMMLGIRRAHTSLPTIRRIAGLEAIEEAVGRATEMGKPIFCTPGWSDITTSTAAPTFAALDIIYYAARLAARYDTEMIVAIAYPNVYPLTEQVVRQAYVMEGKADRYNPGTVVFTSPEQYAYTAACLGIIQREKVAATILVGHFASEAINFAEASAAVNAISISGTESTYQLPFFTAACDYTMIGEELMAAGAYISEDPMRLGAIRGQDYAKLLAFLWILTGAICSTAGFNWFEAILNF
ncbi:MAG TPA: hypothetical protein GX529_03400 [Firmicutes bacterium]|nr:hypothetical protein [Candidatus Fermentithermobacillaceae bacterium]